MDKIYVRAHLCKSTNPELRQEGEVGHVDPARGARRKSRELAVKKGCQLDNEKTQGS